MSTKYRVGVIGLGKFGFWFARYLADLGQEVIGVDSDAEKVKHARQFLSRVYEADAMQKEALSQIGFGEMTHALVSVGDSISSSSMIAMYLKELDVPVVWAKAINADHQKLLDKIGVQKVIIPELMAAKQLANQMAIPGFIDFLPFSQEMVLKEMMVETTAGKTLRDLDLTNRYSVQIIAIKSAGTNNYRFIPKANDILKHGDVLVAIGQADLITKIVL